MSARLLQDIFWHCLDYKVVYLYDNRLGNEIV
jgi:hypothetical protein